MFINFYTFFIFYFFIISSIIGYGFFIYNIVGKSLSSKNIGYIGLTVKHNGTLVARDYNELPNISADWVSQQVTIILNMAASDTVRPYMNTGGTNGQSLENEYRGYSIYLLG